MVRIQGRSRTVLWKKSSSLASFCLIDSQFLLYECFSFFVASYATICYLWTVSAFVFGLLPVEVKDRTLELFLRGSREMRKGNHLFCFLWFILLELLMGR